MSPSELLALLLGAATDAGVAVRTEPFVTTSRRGGGLIRLRGRSVVVLDENASPAERAATLAEALADCDLDHRRVAPAAWEQIVRARARSERAHHELAAHGAPRPRENVRQLPVPKPGLRKRAPERGSEGTGGD